MMDANVVEIILRNIPRDVRAQLKARAALEGKSMQALVLQLIQEYLDKKEA
jgi:plasmid stability protein